MNAKGDKWKCHFTERKRKIKRPRPRLKDIQNVFKMVEKQKQENDFVWGKKTHTHRKVTPQFKARVSEREKRKIHAALLL